ncbi:hypothetical protein LZ31DRAFT_244828 [Colletotrichum somersetense]|nr:hypothetical protein LZ31DRAFT_244828 [Colletotrichum somersetense]
MFKPTVARHMSFFSLPAFFRFLFLFWLIGCAGMDKAHPAPSSVDVDARSRCVSIIAWYDDHFKFWGGAVFCPCGWNGRGLGLYIPPRGKGRSGWVIFCLGYEYKIRLVPDQVESDKITSFFHGTVELRLAMYKDTRQSSTDRWKNMKLNGIAFGRSASFLKCEVQP